MKNKVFRLLTLIFVSLLFAGVFSINNTRSISAELAEIKPGDYFKAGGNIRPGKGVGVWTFDNSITAEDAAIYHEHYTYKYTDRPYARRDNIDIETGLDSYRVGYITKEKYRNVSHDFIVDVENGYYDDGYYYFQLIRSTDGGGYDPLTLYIKAEDKGRPWGIKVVSGDGSESNPFSFGVVMNEPRSISYNIRQGNGKVISDFSRAEPGEKVTFTISPDSGYEIESVSAHDDTSIELERNGNEFSFVMPQIHYEDYKTVNVEVFFKKLDHIASISKDNGMTWVEYSDIEAAKDNWVKGSILRLDADISIDKAFSTSDSGAHMLDLNGHTLKQRAKDDVILVTSNVDLSIYDDSMEGNSVITHEKNAVGRGIAVYGQLHLNGVTIKDNQINEGDGAGVYVDKGGKLFLSGKVDLSTNTKKTPSAISNSNVFLNDAKIEIADDLINDNPIGVTYVNADGQNKGVFTEGLKEYGEISDFASEVSGKVISETADGEAEFADYEEYPVVVSGIRVNSSNRSDVLGDDKVKYDPDTNTLSLNNAGIKIVSSETSFGNAGILYEGKEEFTIVLSGQNAITTGDLARDGSRAIRSQGNLKITGGSLRINLSTENGSSATGIYLNSNYDLSLENTKVEINVNSEDMYAYGIYGKDLSLTNSTLTINNESAGSSSIGAYLYGTVSSMDQASEIEVLSKVKGISDANSFKAVAQQYGAMVNTEASKEGASVWNKSRTLSTFKYLRIPGDLTVTFKDGKTVLEKQIVGKGQQAKEPDDPTKEGYKFQGWFKNGETEAYDFNTPVTSDFELTAKWENNKYTISFVDADETPISKKVYPYGTKAALIEKPADPRKAEDAQYTYTFKGWKPEISDVTKNQTYTAEYDSIEKKYTITFKNGETVLQQSQEKYGATPVYKGPTPSKPATETTVYTFKGWDPEIVSVKTDAVYNAEFSEKAKTYTIRFVNDDGEVLETLEVEHGKMPAPKTPEKAETAQYKYTFAGWDPALVAASGEAVYKATYTTSTREYEIHFVDDDDKELLKGTYAYGTKASDITAPVVESKKIDEKVYEFSGWNPPLMDVSGEKTYKAVYTDKKYTASWYYSTGELIKELTEPMTMDEINTAFPSNIGLSPSMKDDRKWDFTFLNWESKVDEDKAAIAYTAVYSQSPKKYTITWVIDGQETITKLNYGAPLEYGGTTPVKERKEGDHCSYEFDSWEDSDGKPLAEHDTVKEDRTLIAQFKEIPDTYRIRFLDEDGKPVLKEMVVDYGTTAEELDAPVPTKAETAQYSYTFKEWKPAVGEVTGDQDYVAAYEEAIRSYNISFVMDDGTLISRAIYKYGETPSCTGPSKESDDQYEYTFKEWTPAITSVSGEATYVASFDKKEREYKVIYNANGGTGTMADGTRLYSEALTLAECEYSLAGSEFDGWYDQANGGNKIETVPANSKDVTVYAHWKGGEQLIQLDANGGTLPDDQKEIKARAGEPYPSLPTPSKEGVSFEGWYIADGDNPFGQQVIPGKTTVNGNTPLTARYQYTVTYISEKDKVFMTEFIFEDSEEPATKPESSPEKEGYTFMAWGAADGKPYDFEKPVKESLTLRAIYFRYAYEEGEKTWVKVGNGDLSFRFVRYELMNSEKESDKDLKADFDIDKKIYVDNVLLKESDYVCENGSLIAKLHDSLLNSLSVGNHTLKVVFTDGEVSAPFVVKEREKPSTPSYIPPKTGDQ